MLTFLDLLRRYLPPVLPAAALGVAVFFAALLILRRRGRRLSAAWKLWLLVSCVYIFALVFVLALRTSTYDPLVAYRSLSLDLFYGYRVLLHNFNAHGFINEFMNILIFVPLGFLLTLPFGERRSRWLVIPLGFLTSLTVEALQYLLGSGISDVDDLFNNTLGTACGFALARFCMNVRGKRAMRSAASLALALICLSPPFIAWAVWSASPYGMSELDIRQGEPVAGEVTFSEDAAAFLDGLQGAELGVYSTPGGNLDSARECADKFYAVFNEKRDMEDLYDESAWFRATDGQLSVVYRYAGPEIEYVDYHVYSSRIKSGGSDPGLSETKIRALLSGWGLEIPSGGEFSDEEGAYVFSFDPASGLGGEISAAVMDGKLARVDWCVYETELIGYASPISRDECARRIYRGDFSWWELPEGDVRVESAKAVYTLDSKGTYRPVLELTLSGGETLWMSMWLE